MNISTDLKQITPDFKKSFGGYEWWYFDGLSDNGKEGIVIIIYETNPFSTRYIRELDNQTNKQKFYPAISVSLYKNGKTIYYSFMEFDEGAFNWSEDSKELKIGKDSVRYSATDESLDFELTLDQQLESGYSVHGVIKGQGVKSHSKLIESVSEDQHAWNLLLPVVDLEVKLHVNGVDGEEEVHFDGKGYHDHNTGQEPMMESFKDWYWGRYHFEGFTLVYYLMQKHGSTQFEGWLIDQKNQEVLEYFQEAELGYFSRNWFGLNSARKIELKSGQVAVNIQCITKIDDGPFYQRFIGNSIINYNGQVHAAHGISEYIYPINIHSRLYWPLVHMRLRYMDAPPHWVQKSKLMYPWTW
jgi:carotenoid 1,2-hydratase